MELRHFDASVVFIKLNSLEHLRLFQLNKRKCCIKVTFTKDRAQTTLILLKICVISLRNSLKSCLRH